MKKRILFPIILALLALPALLLTACFPTTDGALNGGPTYQMTAVIESLDSPFSVNVIDAEYAEGIYWLVTDGKTVYLASDGSPTDRTALSVGDTGLITYNGQVMLSYPPQVFALTVQKK